MLRFSTLASVISFFHTNIFEFHFVLRIFQIEQNVNKMQNVRQLKIKCFVMRAMINFVHKFPTKSQMDNFDQFHIQHDWSTNHKKTNNFESRNFSTQTNRKGQILDTFFTKNKHKSSKTLNLDV